MGTQSRRDTNIEKIKNLTQASLDKLLIPNLPPITEIFQVTKGLAEQDFLTQILFFRKSLFYFLISLMSVETFLLFLLVFLKALPMLKFSINDTTLQILVGATIAQISAMVIVIIKSVFPDSLNKIFTPSKNSTDN